MLRKSGLLLLASALLSSYSNAQDCSVDVVGLCTPGVIETIVIDTVTTTEVSSTGHTTIDVITTTTTTETTSNETSVDLLDSDNGFVTPKKDGNLAVDWGGVGSANTSTCSISTDGKCGGLTSSSLTTYIQTVDISDLSLPGNGGKVNYGITIKKEDASDYISIHITGKDGGTTIFDGTHMLADVGTTTSSSTFSNGFDFGGKLTSITIEIRGQNVGVALDYAQFTNVEAQVLYNLISTIVSEHIQTIETFIALDLGFNDDLVEDFFDNNEVIENDAGDIVIVPVAEEPDIEVTVETVEAEIDFQIELDLAPVVEINLPGVEAPSIETSEIEVTQEIEAAIEAELEEVVEVVVEQEPETVEVETVEVETVEPDVVSPEPEPEVKVVVKAKVKAKPTKKQIKAAAKKIIQKIKPKARYSVEGQTKTLIVMNILADNKSFFDEGRAFTQTDGFFSSNAITSPDNVDNFLANLQFIGFNNTQMSAMINSQYGR
tara:strand:- start:18166 stop:19635 length:1470 start_codon:yes stop_codon:yes gene_type:complete